MLYLAERIVVLAEVGECKIMVDENEQHGGQEARRRRGEEREAREQGQMCHLQIDCCCCLLSFQSFWWQRLM